MLRMPKFKVINPKTIEEVTEALDKYPSARFIAGGTDLNPNLKHRLLEPSHIIALNQIEEMFGIEETETGLRIGAMESLTSIESSKVIQNATPGLASAARQVSGPQLRNMGTIGGNVMLDTRCQWYNQTYFWRKSLGFCLKKDGTACHVIEKGSKCVAAASNDTAAALSTLNAQLEFIKDKERILIPIQDIWQADGIWNKKVSPQDLLVAIHLSKEYLNHAGSYSKLRDRKSIDFPLLGVAARLNINSNNIITDSSIVVVALQARPWPLKKAAELLLNKKVNSEEFSDALEECGAIASKQCRPMPNIPGDHEYRHKMVPIFVKRAIQACLKEV